MLKRPLAAIVFLVVAGLGGFISTARAVEVQLAEEGRALFPVVVSADASEELKQLAAEFAGYLSRISGAGFKVEQTDSERGIVLRRVSRDPLPVFEREQYSIRSHKEGVLLSAATDLAVQHAVWDFLHRLGYRQFFPGKHWEVVPSKRSIRVDLDITESPDYHYRHIWYGFGPWDYNREPWDDWRRKNRMGGGLLVHSGHAYGGIIAAKKAAFDQHPEYYALVNGERQVQPQAKLCISNPELRKLVVEYARDTFASRPDQDCISMDPSDGGGWCECEHCRALGSPSDRALLLANQVAEAFPERFVGMYAYNYHSAPPTIEVRPNVLINVATAFIKGGMTLDSVISGWSKKGATLGIREYYSVNTWDRDLPGSARGSNLEYLETTIPRFHSQRARFLNAESSDNWGCNGLGYYFASRALWDIEEASRREAIVEDFLNAAFGAAKQPMRTFYTLIDGANKNSKLVYEDLLARMYRSLAEARRLASDDAVRARIDDLILYTVYVDLYDQYRNASGKARQAAFEQTIRHAYRMRKSMMVHTKALYRDLAARDRSVTIPEEARWSVPESKNPWKSSAPFTNAEIEQYLEAGIARHEPLELDFEPREFSDELVPAAPLRLASVPAGQAQRGRGLRSWYTFLEQPGKISLNITGGLIAHYRDRGNVKVSVWKLGGASETGEKETLVATDASVPPDGVERTVEISLAEAGLYRIDLNDGSDLTQVTWPTGQPMTWKLSLDDHPRSLSGRWNLWFYVPKGVTRIGLYVRTTGGNVKDPNGKIALKLGDQPGKFLSVEVPAGGDGRLWKLENVSGIVCLLNVPPFAARTAEELLLPAEVVADRAAK